LTERKRTGQNKPKRDATRDYRNNKKDNKRNKCISTTNSINKVSEVEEHDPSSLKHEEANSTASTTRNDFVPEVSGSSSYDVTSEIKDSASIHEDDLKKAISNVQKKEPIIAEDLSLQPSTTNPYLVSVNQMTLQEQLSVFGRSQERTSYYEIRRLDFDNPFMSSMALWQNVMSNWIDIIKHFSENIANMMREYWIKPFWISQTIHAR
jgi:hypothetical protein